VTRGLPRDNLVVSPPWARQTKEKPLGHFIRFSPHHKAGLLPQVLADINTEGATTIKYTGIRS